MFARTDFILRPSQTLNLRYTHSRLSGENFNSDDTKTRAEVGVFQRDTALAFRSSRDNHAAPRIRLHCELTRI